MKNMEREKFEESWKQAFDEAEVAPSEKVWTNIELDLEKAKGGELKKRLMFYQMLAAASVVFAMAIGGVGYYYTFNNEGTGNTLAGHSAENETPGVLSDPLSETNPTATLKSPATPEEDPTSSGEVTDSRIPTGDVPSVNDAVLSSTPTSVQVAANVVPDASGGTGGSSVIRERDAALPSNLADRELPSLYEPRHVELNFEKDVSPADPVQAMLAMLERREREVQSEKEQKQKKNKSDAENLWTSIGFAAGSFNALQAPSASGSSGSMAAMALAAPIVDQESRASGYSYSMGLNVGTRISERWVLQGGVNYLTQSSEYTSTSVVADGPGFMMAERYKPATTNALVNADEFELRNRIVYSAPYSVNNDMRYLSIPVQAGYLLVNKTIGVQLNAGVATDLFLQNTVEGESDQLDRTTVSSGADSPYRTVNLSGLVGTEVSYRFGPHYRISLNPGLRYPFSTIYKTEIGVQSSPLTFDVGLRFRYIFR